MGNRRLLLTILIVGKYYNDIYVGRVVRCASKASAVRVKDVRLRVKREGLRAGR